MSKTYTPPPTDFGSPAKFSSWRDGQDTLFWDILDCKKRFSIHNAPVGMGKSLCYLTAALAEGKRTAFITESKALQDQLCLEPHGDFVAVGLFDMRGLSNYTCRALTEGGLLETLWQKKWGRPTCDVGPCTAGIRCDLKNEGCDYFDDYRKACSAKLVCTNYAYWIAIHRYGQGLGKFDLLVLDECHQSDQQLSAALSVDFTEKDFKVLKSARPKSASSIQIWRMWGREQLRRIQGKLEFFTEGARIGQTIGPEGVLALIQDTDLPDASELKQWKRLETKCQTLSEAQDDWIVELNDFNGSVRFAPVWVRNYSESALFRSIPRVVMMSATVRPKITDLLNIPAQHAEFREYPSTFPVERRPIYWIPTVRMNYEMSQEDLRTWAVRIDNIIAKRLDRKGIVHTRCVEPKTRILTSDLKWVPASDIRKGDKLLAFDEFAQSGKGSARKWKQSVVEDYDIIKSRCVRVTMGDGTSIVCSRDHLWLTHNGVEPRWVRACNLMAGKNAASHIMRVLDTWETGTEWEHGYLAAAYEGEGHLYQKKYKGKKPSWQGRSLAIVFSQKDNCMLERTKQLLTKFGFSYKENYDKRKPVNARVMRVVISGKAAVLRFLGLIRPERLKRKLNMDDLGKFAKLRRERVIRVEDVGEQDVVFMKTSSATYIAEGLASHNSYERQQYLLAHSRFRHLMFANTTSNTRDVVHSFRNAEAPAVLVSPSVGTGFDFPFEMARYQIIGKVPFRDARGDILKAQVKDDPDYLNYLTAQDLIQMYGRIIRDPRDFGESFILDDNVEWFLRDYAGFAYDKTQGVFNMKRKLSGAKNFFPEYFLEAFKRVEHIPTPPTLELIQSV